MGFEPTMAEANGFAIRSLSPLGHAAGSVLRPVILRSAARATTAARPVVELCGNGGDRGGHSQVGSHIVNGGMKVVSSSTAIMAK